MSESKSRTQILKRIYHQGTPSEFLAAAGLTMDELLDVVHAAEEWYKTTTSPSASIMHVANMEGKIAEAVLNLQKKRGEKEYSSDRLVCEFCADRDYTPHDIIEKLDTDDGFTCEECGQYEKLDYCRGHDLYYMSSCPNCDKIGDNYDR